MKSCARHVWTLIVLMGGVACADVTEGELGDAVCEVAPREPLPSLTPPPGDGTLVAAASHSCALIEGRLACWGSNERGALGRPGDGSTVPVLIGEEHWSELSGRDRHTCVRVDSRLACWGENRAGQLGLGDTVPRGIPTALDLPYEIVSIAAGFAHSCALDAEGILRCWGSNAEGDLGTCQDAVLFELPSPVALQPWLFAAMGEGHGCAIDPADHLYCWGRNTSSELGLGGEAPQQVHAPTQVGTMRWRSVALGQNYTCGLAEGGELYCWGRNSSNQLGTGNTEPRRFPSQIHAGPFTRVAVDSFHGCAVRENGQLQCWGRNDEGQLGTGDTESRMRPAVVDDAHDWVDVAVGRFHTCARKSDDSIWCTGENREGELGVGDRERRSVFTRVHMPEELDD